MTAAPLTHRDVVARIPVLLAERPRDHRGYPVPWFVPRREATPAQPAGWDFKHVDPARILQAVLERRCWICGNQFTSTESAVAFVVGPMCVVNRVSSEPPSHVQCARYAARACPFLARPQMLRAPAVPGRTAKPAGIMLERNPGVAVVYLTRTPTFSPSSRLFDLGDPRRVWWYARGRDATRAEVQASLDSGMPALEKLARKDGPEALRELARLHEAATSLLPPPALEVQAS